MRNNYLKREYERLYEENIELRRQLKWFKKSEQDIVALLEEYMNAIEEFNRTKKEYDELIASLRLLQKRREKDFDSILIR